MLSSDCKPVTTPETRHAFRNDARLFPLAAHPRLLEAFAAALLLDPELCVRPGFRRLVARLIMIGQPSETWNPENGPLADTPQNKSGHENTCFHAKVWRLAQDPRDVEIHTVETLLTFEHEKKLWDDLCLAWKEVTDNHLRRSRFQLQAKTPLAKAFRVAVTRALLTLGYVPF